MKRDRWQRGVAACDEPFFFFLSSSSSLFASMLLRFNCTLSFAVSLMSFACLPTSISAPRLRPHGTRLHAGSLAVRTVITQQHTVVRKTQFPLCHFPATRGCRCTFLKTHQEVQCFCFGDFSYLFIYFFTKIQGRPLGLFWD